MLCESIKEMIYAFIDFEHLSEIFLRMTFKRGRFSIFSKFYPCRVTSQNGIPDLFSVELDFKMRNVTCKLYFVLENYN